MALLSPDHALELCRQVVAASPADETEVHLTCEEDRFVRFASSGPTQDGDRERYELAVRVRFPGDGGYREARATCGSLDEADWRAALDRALTLARVSAPDPDRVPLGGAVDVPGSAPHRPTQDHTFREKAEWVRAALAACDAEDLDPAGLARTSVVSRTLVNSAGREVHGSRSRASFSLTASPRGGATGDAGVCEEVHANVDQLDPERVVRVAVEKGARGRSPEVAEPGATTVVLEPLAVSSLLLFAAYQGFGAREYAEERSFLCGRLGERLFPDSLHLVDDCGHEAYPGWRFDGEGSPRRRVELLRDGALQGYVTDGAYAARLGRPNTGHARPQPSPGGPVAENLVLAPGYSTLDQLVGEVDDGLLVTRFHYTNLIEPRDLTLTGMTRGGTFRIRGGKVVGPVTNLRFTQSLVQALQNVTGVGHRAAVSGALFSGEVSCPALRIEDFRFTSSTGF